MVMIFVAVIAAPAQAVTQKIVFPDGSYCISGSTVKTFDTIGSTPGVRMSTASGWGGTPSSSGARSVYVWSKGYNILGMHLVTVTSGVYWEWSGGHVTYHKRYVPKLSTYNQLPLTSVTLTYSWGPAWHFTWNGKADGGWYASTNMRLEQSIFKYGTFGIRNLVHEYKVQANGRYWWKATS